MAIETRYRCDAAGCSASTSELAGSGYVVVTSYAVGKSELVFCGDAHHRQHLGVPVVIRSRPGREARAAADPKVAAAIDRAEAFIPREGRGNAPTVP